VSGDRSADFVTVATAIGQRDEPNLRPETGQPILRPETSNENDRNTNASRGDAVPAVFFSSPPKP